MRRQQVAMVNPLRQFRRHPLLGKHLLGCRRLIRHFQPIRLPQSPRRPCRSGSRRPTLRKRGYSHQWPTVPRNTLHSVRRQQASLLRAMLRPDHPPPPPKRPKSRRRGGGWFQAFAAIVLGLTVLLCLGLSVLIFQYYQIASDLPNVQNLRDQAAKFESTYIYDSAGESLYEINDPNQGRRTYVRLQDVSPYVIAATLATEDKNFWNSLGFDPVGITRAVVQNYTAGGTISGASTITQQLARALLLSPEERLQRSSTRKIREIILAAQMRATYKPDDILELYLNEIYYGNLAYGIEAAAQTYFKKSAKELNFAEATFLAGLPQSPAIYDVFQTPRARLCFEPP
jgi:membrane peptidoglycan carboxypeptidase